MRYSGWLSAVSALLLVGSQTTSAADCFDEYPPTCSPEKRPDADRWTARENFCGGNRWTNDTCYQYSGVEINMDKPGSNDQQTCWDALENIIDQCTRGGHVYSYGRYNYNGVKYSMDFCRTTLFCPPS